MRKKWLFIPLLLLAAIGIITLACPSEPEDQTPPPPPLEEDEIDFTITGSNYKVEIPTDGEGGFVITKDKQYRVTFALEKADADFYGSRVGGKLVCKENGEGEDKVLAGWTWLNPPIIYAPGIYRWLLTAGDKGKDGESESIFNDGTTPEGATQYFAMNIQTSDYKQYESYFVFNFKGSITVEEYTPPVGEKTNSGEIALAFNDASHDAAIGKGNIEGDEFEKVKTASGNGAFLRFYITGATVTAKAGEEGHGVGAVGNKENVGDVNVNYPLNIPRGTAAKNNFSFEVDILVEDALEFVGEDESHIFINMWGDGPAVCSKVELWEYK